jgi:hypothetical protein
VILHTKYTGRRQNYFDVYSKALVGIDFEVSRGELIAVVVGPHPIVTVQYSSTALYQVSDHNQSLFF